MSMSPGAGYDANRNTRLLQKHNDVHYNDVGTEDDFNMNASDNVSAAKSDYD